MVLNPPTISSLSGPVFPVFPADVAVSSCCFVISSKPYNSLFASFTDLPVASTAFLYCFCARVACVKEVLPVRAAMNLPTKDTTLDNFSMNCVNIGNTTCITGAKAEAKLLFQVLL